MNIIRLSEETRMAKPCAATIGFFDGVHMGHRHLIAAMKEAASAEGMETTVITFDRHPRQILRSDYQPKLLSTYEEKMVLLAQTGIDNCIIVPFDEFTASLSARDFMEKILKKRLGVKTLIVGHDHRFGHNRTEGYEEYVVYGREMGMDVRRGEPYTIDGVTISSSVVRSLLLEGETAMADRCLGYPYSFTGTVVEGEHQGTKMGFPTANIVPADENKLVPANGVYGIKVRIEGTMQNLHGMMNIGTRPTFDGDKQTIEVHIFRFSGDLYGQNLTIYLGKRLRAERKFPNNDELVAQLHEDMQAVEAMFMEETGEEDFITLHGVTQ